MVREARQHLFQTFHLKEEEFQLFFHSGATEALNQIMKGFVLKNSSPQVLYCSTDHSAVVKQKILLERLGASCFEISVNLSGELDWAQLESEIGRRVKVGPTLLNLTWMNNETGQVLDLKKFAQLKQQFKDLWIHIDAVQAPLKIEDWQTPNSAFDAYTYSGHKFGALKGIGMTFIKNNFPFTSLIEGGGQQFGLRSGTENVPGIYSLSVALHDCVGYKDFAQDRQKRDWFEAQLKKDFGEQVIFVGQLFKFRNTSTSNVIFKKQNSDITTMALDIEGLEVSSGSACSSGATIPSRVLLSMGYPKEQALQAIRISFPPALDQIAYEEIALRFKRVLSRYL